MIYSIDGYAAQARELGYSDGSGNWIPNGAVEYLANQVEVLQARTLRYNHSTKALEIEE